MSLRYQLRYLRYERRPWIIWDAHLEKPVFRLRPLDKTFSERIVANLNGQVIEEATV